jgi:hypothetical protein
MMSRWQATWLESSRGCWYLASRCGLYQHCISEITKDFWTFDLFHRVCLLGERKRLQKSLDANGMDQNYYYYWSCGILDMSCGLANFRSFFPSTKTGQDQKSKLSKTRCDERLLNSSRYRLLTSIPRTESRSKWFGLWRSSIPGLNNWLLFSHPNSTHYTGGMAHCLWVHKPQLLMNGR